MSCRRRHATALLVALAALLGPTQGVHAQVQAGAARAVVPPAIDGVEVNADAGVAPGSTLDLKVRGTPHGRASVLLPGADAPLVLRETDPGVYAGSYTVQASERIDPDATIRASVGSGLRVTTARFRFPPSFRGTETAAVKPVSAIAPAAVHAPSAPQTTAVMGAAATPPAPLLLQMVQPRPGALVTPTAGLLVEGRTAPNALVRTRIDAVPPTTPGRASVAQLVMEETVQADADGRFQIDLGPQRAAPGTHFEIGVRAMQGGQSTPEQRVVAEQGQG